MRRTTRREADKIDQQQSPYCGPTAFWRSLLKDDPVAYTDAVLTLYQTGRTEIGRLVIEPSAAVRNSSPKWGLSPVDWITLGDSIAFFHKKAPTPTHMDLVGR